MEFVVDGKSVFAATGGQPFERARRSIVFVHGAGMDHTVWALQTRYFAHRGRNVLAIDLPGHGRSAGKALPAIDEMADWLARLLKLVFPQGLLLQIGCKSNLGLEYWKC